MTRVSRSGKKLDVSGEKPIPGGYQLRDQVVAINRVTRVVRGGKNMSFAALVVVGDPIAGVVGYGSGKAKEVPQAIRKGIESAKRNLMQVNLTQNSIPHAVLGRFGSGKVLLKPAPEGTGVIAGGVVRAVMTSAGVQNVLTKSLGAPNPHSVIKATFDALKKLGAKEEGATGEAAIHNPKQFRQSPTPSLLPSGRSDAPPFPGRFQLNALREEFDALLAGMQTPKAKKAMRSAFNASPEKLGKAALAAQRKRG